MSEKPTDVGTWVCEGCGEKMIGERAEPPLDHSHNCEEYSSGDLNFKEGSA